MTPAVAKWLLKRAKSDLGSAKSDLRELNRVLKLMRFRAANWTREAWEPEVKVYRKHVAQQKRVVAELKVVCADLKTEAGK